MVSIILSTYNRPKLLERAVESVFKQTYQNFELIIIDDCSNGRPILKDSRIKVITNSTNLGIAKSLNRGIKEAKGKYIARIDDDDCWIYPNKLAKQVAFLDNNPDYVLVGGNAIRTDRQGKETIQLLLPETDQEIRQNILRNNPFVQTAVMFRRELVVGGYDEGLSFSEDYDLWLKFGLLGKLYNFPEYFVKYASSYQDKQGMSGLNVRKNILTGMKVRKRYRHDYSGYNKAIILCWISYFYSFLPFNKVLWKIMFKIKRAI